MQGGGAQMRCGSIAGFQIGDFVWGKIHGNLWWPGQVCDPSDASEQARDSEHVDGHLLVAYFGDNTLAWCQGSLLKPFKEEFQQMVEQNSSQSFVDAVNDAMFEVERCLRSDMTCYCVPPEKIAQFRIGRKNDVGNASVANYSPAAFLDHLQDVAQDISVANKLDVTLLRSWAASFYLRNGCLVKMIENLFDEKQTNLNSLVENSYKDKDKHGRDVRMNGGRAVRRPQISREEASRKKRSIAELILVADPDLTVEEKLGAFEEETGGLNQKKKKKKVMKVGVMKVTNEEENGFARRERKKSKYLSPPYTNAYREQRSNSLKTVDSEGSENESENSLNLQTKFPDDYEEPRKEVDPVARSSIYTESSTYDILGKLLFAACNPLHKGRNTPVETVREFFVNHRNFAYSGVLELENLSMKPCGDSGTGEMAIEFSHASRRKRNNSKDESKQETVLGLNRNRERVKKDQVTTETPMSDHCLNGVVSFTGRLRNRRNRGKDEAGSESVEEIDHMAFNSIKEGRSEDKKNKTRGVVNDGNVGESIHESPISSRHKRKSNTDVSNGQYNTDLDLDKSGKSVLKTKRSKFDEGSNENSVALLLTFSPGSTLPSKDELLVVFSKYGALIKHETELFRDPGCARVVFARGADAKKALSGIKKSNNFPFSVVDWQSFDLPQSPDIPSRSESDNTELMHISQDLQKMVRTLSPKKGHASHGLKPDVAKDLVDDIKGLLKKVNKLIT